MLLTGPTVCQLRFCRTNGNVGCSQQDNMICIATYTVHCITAANRTLYLQDAAVRETAVTALLELYGDEDNVAAMHDLTERFTPRFATLIHDVDEGVAVKGVSTCHTAAVRGSERHCCIFTWIDDDVVTSSDL